MNGLTVGCNPEAARRNCSVVQHAVLRGASQALCGETIQLIVIGDWQVPFVPTLESSCEECVRELVRRSRS